MRRLARPAPVGRAEGPAHHRVTTGVLTQPLPGSPHRSGGPADGATDGQALRIGSLCSGYGGLDMAVQAVFGGTVTWVADPDPGPARILAHHYPDVPNLGDITATDWTGVEPVDVLVGGYPCQPFSTAGHRKGANDPRHIWPHIAAALGVLRPRLGVFENVAAHVGMGFGDVLADLARIGFDAEWTCLRASDVGAPHQRNRLFLLTWPTDPGHPPRHGHRSDHTRPSARRRRHADRSGCSDPAGRTSAALSDRCRPSPAHPIGFRSGRGGTPGTGRWHEPAHRRRPAPPHPQSVAERGPADAPHPVTGSRHARPVPGRGGLHRGRPCHTAPHQEPHHHLVGHEDRQAARGADAPDPASVLAPEEIWGPYAGAVARWAPVIGRTAPRPTDAMGRLNPGLVEWMMGLPPGHVTAVPGLSRAAQLKALGNGVLPLQAATAVEHLAQRAHARGAPIPALMDIDR
ncbi:DNA cytosine methyltransferase [Streptomyces sp. NPDC020379]|uniref:DNA cytosine methyltransferase n=1 Tax=Streptomyces sp. NPDC020379 TaxID=3365071 RepID=UPI00379017EB